MSVDNDEGLVIDVPFRGDHETVATHGWQDSDVLKKRLIERGKLAACAPELARMLHKVEGLCDSEDARDVAMFICKEWKDEIRELLAKAGVELLK